MKRVILNSLVILSLVVCISFPVMAKTPEVKQLKDGWYIQYHQDVYYLVDTKTQLCFVWTRGNGITLIPSENLKNREEWRNIITW